MDACMGSWHGARRLAAVAPMLEAAPVRQAVSRCHRLRSGGRPRFGTRFRATNGFAPMGTPLRQAVPLRKGPPRGRRLRSRRWSRSGSGLGTCERLHRHTSEVAVLLQSSTRWRVVMRRASRPTLGNRGDCFCPRRAGSASCCASAVPGRTYSMRSARVSWLPGFCAAGRSPDSRLPVPSTGCAWLPSHFRSDWTPRAPVAARRTAHSDEFVRDSHPIPFSSANRHLLHRTL